MSEELKLDNDDLETIIAIGRNQQSGRVTNYELKELVRVYREAGASNTLIEEQAARIAEAEKDYHEERRARYAVQSQLVASQTHIEELEQKLRTTSLEALAISDTNNELQARIAELERERDEYLERSIAHDGQRQIEQHKADHFEARLSEAVKVLEPLVQYLEDDGPILASDIEILSNAKAFLATLGEET